MIYRQTNLQKHNNNNYVNLVNLKLLINIKDSLLAM